MEEHAGKLWFGICAGRTVPSARLALAGTRITALDKTNTVMECFMDPSVAKNPDPVWAACHAMDMTLTGPRIPEDVVPRIPAITDTDRGGTLNSFHPDPYHSQVFRHHSDHTARPACFE